jgi:hypothetical protein
LAIAPFLIASKNPWQMTLFKRTTVKSVFFKFSKVIVISGQKCNLFIAKYEEPGFKIKRSILKDSALGGSREGQESCAT